MKNKNADTGFPRIPRFIESGPLVIDFIKDRAFMEDECLKLTEQQVTSLYLLVQREGQHMTFDTLYKAVWEPLDHADCRDAAREGMDRLTETLNAAGQGTVRIEAAPEGYRYRLVLQTI